MINILPSLRIDLIFKHRKETLPKDKYELFNKLKSSIELYNDYQYKSIPALKISTIQASILKKLCTICYGKNMGYKHFSKLSHLVLVFLVGGDKN